MINRILILVGFLILFSLSIWFVLDIKKVLKEDLDDFNNANYPMEGTEINSEESQN
jgi:hypothetical protein